MVTVTTGWSLVLALVFAVGPVDVLAVEVVGFTALHFPLLRGFTPFPLPIAPLFFPLEATLRTWEFALVFVLVTTVGCCSKTLCSAVDTTACKSLYFL